MHADQIIESHSSDYISRSETKYKSVSGATYSSSESDTQLEVSFLEDNKSYESDPIVEETTFEYQKSEEKNEHDLIDKLILGGDPSL